MKIIQFKKKRETKRSKKEILILNHVFSRILSLSLSLKHWRPTILMREKKTQLIFGQIVINNNNNSSLAFETKLNYSKKKKRQKREADETQTYQLSVFPRSFLPVGLRLQILQL